MFIGVFLRLGVVFSIEKVFNKYLVFEGMIIEIWENIFFEYTKIYRYLSLIKKRNEEVIRNIIKYFNF